MQLASYCRPLLQSPSSLGDCTYAPLSPALARCKKRLHRLVKPPYPAPGAWAGSGAHRALRAPGSAFRRPTLADGTSARRPVETGKQHYVPEDVKRPRRSGLTDRGLAALLTYLTQPQSPPPSSQGHQSAERQEQQQRLRQTEAPQCQLPLYSTIGEPMAMSIVGPRAWTATVSGGGVGRGLRMLRLGGTDVGDVALRSLAGLSRLELPGCKGVSDLGLLQVRC